MRTALAVATTAAYLLFAAAHECSAQAAAYKATLTWVDNSTNEDGFNIERADQQPGGAPGPFTQIGSVAANVLSYVDTPIPAGAARCWRVIAFNVAGASAPSPVACATAPIPPVPPNAPGSVQIIITIAN